MAINWYPGHMAKAKRDFYELSKISDFIIEIVDARIPIASSNPDVEELIRKQKKYILKYFQKVIYRIKERLNNGFNILDNKVSMLFLQI